MHACTSTACNTQTEPPNHPIPYKYSANMDMHVKEYMLLHIKRIFEYIDYMNKLENFTQYLYSNLESLHSLIAVPGTDQRSVEVIYLLDVVFLVEVQCLLDRAILQVVQLLQAMLHLVPGCQGLGLHYM